jgi:hypothetical protein
MIPILVSSAWTFFHLVTGCRRLSGYEQSCFNRVQAAQAGRSRSYLSFLWRHRVQEMLFCCLKASGGFVWGVRVGPEEYINAEFVLAAITGRVVQVTPS